MTSPLRILHLDCTRGRGGQEMDHLAEAKEFSRQGHRYVIGARPGTYLLEEAQRQGCGLALPLKSNFDIVSFFLIRTFIKREKIGILVTTSYIDAVLGWFSALSLGKRRPVVVRQRHLLNPPKGLLPFRRFCDAIVAVSDIARFGYIERKVPFWKVVAIPRGIHEEEASAPVPPVSLPGIPDAARVILQIGTFQRDKGQLPLLESLRLPMERHPDLHLVLLGEGPLRPNIERRLSSPRFASLRDRIHLPGFKKTEPYYARASVLAVSSFRESYSLVILEAFSRGVTVVGFRQGGVTEAFARGGWGELVAPWNFTMLAQRITAWALRAKKADLREGEGGFPVGAFDVARSVERTERYYRWLLERQASGTLAQNPYLASGGRIDPFAEPEEKENGKRTEGLTEEASESGRF